MYDVRYPPTDPGGEFGENQSKRTVAGTWEIVYISWVAGRLQFGSG